MHRGGLSDARAGGRAGGARRGRGAQEATRRVHAERRQVCSGGRRALSGCFWGGRGRVRGASGVTPGGPGESKKTWCRWPPAAVWAPPSAPHYIGGGFSCLRGAPRGVSREPPRIFKKVWYRWTPHAVWAPPSVTHYIGQGALSRGGLFFGPGQESPGEPKKTWCRWTRAAVRAPPSVPDYRGPPDPARAARGRPPCPAAAPAQGGPQAPAPAPGHPVDPAGIRRSPQGHKPCMPAHPGGGGRLRTTVAPPAAVPASRTPLATRRQDVRARAGARGRAA